jgi:peptide/nickel transport system permease protein
VSGASALARDVAERAAVDFLPRTRERRRTVVLRSLLADKVTLGAVVFLLLLIGAAALAPVIVPFEPGDQSLLMRNQPPMTDPEEGGRVPHLLGTDFLGRDQLSRLIYGARISLLVAFFGVLFAGLAGTAIGVLAGYHRGLFDDVVMRLVDLQMSFPILLIALVVLYVLGAGLWNLVFVLAVTRWTIYARVTRGMVLADREQLFVEAARASGADNRRIILRHLVPNLVPTLLVLATLEAASLMLAEATLSFLGLGLPLAEPSWGQMLATGRPYITNAWWLITFPGLAILLTVLSLNLIGVWARRVMDPLGR